MSNIDLQQITAKSGSFKKMPTELQEYILNSSGQSANEFLSIFQEEATLRAQNDQRFLGELNQTANNQKKLTKKVEHDKIKFDEQSEQAEQQAHSEELIQQITKL